MLGVGCGKSREEACSWTSNCPSVGGRETLIESALTNLPVYFLSVFRCPASIIHRIEKLQRDFLWHGASDNKIPFGLLISGVSSD